MCQKTRHHVERHRLITLYRQLCLEVNGLRVRKNSAYSQIRNEFHFSGNRTEVAVKFAQLLNATGVFNILGFEKKSGDNITFVAVV